MKRTFLSLILCLALIGAGQVPPKADHCTAITKKGNACQCKPIKGTDRCYFHTPKPLCKGLTKKGTHCQLKADSTGYCHIHRNKH